MVDGSKSAKEAFKDMAASMVQMITKMIMQMMILNALKASPLGSLFAKDGGVTPEELSSGGVMSRGRKLPAYGPGGVARGPRAGYPAILHGTEAVVPLPNNRHIPVEMKGGGGTVNNINISVSVDKEGNESTDTDGTREGEGFAKAISAAVQQELHNQKRHGGMLSPFGVA
jgi:phage-related minor tail protein